MRKYKVLCLTDHVKHSEENSMYAILNGLMSNDSCDSVCVASRSNPKNADFFRGQDLDNLLVTKVGDGLSFDPSGNQFINDTEKKSTDDFDIIFLRLPRPISDDFLKAIAEKFKDKVIINHPLGIIETSSKAFLLKYPELCPPIKLVKTKEDILSFAEDQGIVLKPLKEYGGKGIVRIVDGIVSDGDEEYKLVDYLSNVDKVLGSEGMLAMRYLKNVSNGDKRLLVVDGKILAASLRMPPKDSWLCNVARGGYSVKTEATHEEHLIVDGLKEELNKKGILIFGVDTLEDDSGKRVLSEINTLSIGGFPQAEKQTGEPIIAELSNKIFEHASRS